MAHPSEELVRRGYEAFNRGDVETLRQLFADTTIWHEPGRGPTVLVFHILDGEITETRSHHSDRYEFDEFWA
jgi:SnoaL-like domain